MTFNPDPKPSGRHVATRTEWEQLRALKLNGPCRGCGGAPDQLHHCVPRGVGGDDEADNLIPVCYVCHDAHHAANNEAVTASIRASFTPAELWYMWTVKSKAWVDRVYPQPAAPAPADESNLCSRCRKPRVQRAKLDKARPRKRWVLTVPADAENGADVLDALIPAAAARMELGYDEATPAYFVVVAALAQAAQ